MLLSFFIVLNSLSTFDSDKAEAVVKSVNESFWNDKPEITETFAPEVAAAAKSFRKGDTLDRVKDLFTSTLPAISAHKNRLGNILTVELSRKDFEILLGITEPPPKKAFDPPPISRGRFTDLLAALLDTKVSNAYEMDILLNTEISPAELRSLDLDTSEILVEKVASYAQILQDKNMDTKLITPGLAKGRADTVTLTFKRYTPVKIQIRSKTGGDT